MAKSTKQQFRIQAATLKMVLDKVGLAAGTATVLPLTSDIMVTITRNKGYILGTDLQMQIGYGFEVESEIEAEFLLPFDLLSKIVSLSKGLTMTFTINSKNIVIETETDKYQLASHGKVEEFPKALLSPKDNIETALPDILPELKRALQTVSKDASRTNLNHVLLEIRPKVVTIASTDGSYVVFSNSLEAATAKKVDLLVPAKVIKAMEGLEQFTIAWDEKKFSINSEDITIIVVRPEEKFVNFRAIFPPEFTANTFVDKAEIMAALEKCGLSRDYHKTTKLDLKAKAINANDMDNGVNINVNLMELDYKGSVEAVSFNSDKMMKILHQVPYKSVNMAIHDAKRAIILRSEEAPGYLGLIMPLAF